MQFSWERAGGNQIRVPVGGFPAVPSPVTRSKKVKWSYYQVIGVPADRGFKFYLTPHGPLLGLFFVVFLGPCFLVSDLNYIPSSVICSLWRR